MKLLQAPKKSLGQNFLIDQNIINKIIKIGNIENDKTVLEIGCGMGIYPIKFKNLFENKEYLGLDIGEPAIDFCKKKSDFNFMCGDLLKIKLDKITISQHSQTLPKRTFPREILFLGYVVLYQWLPVHRIS